MQTAPTATIQTRITSTIKTKATATIQTNPSGTIQTRTTSTLRTRSTSTVQTRPTGTSLTTSIPALKTAFTPTGKIGEIVGSLIRSKYTKEECVKCHDARVNDIKEAGGKHKSVPCVGCHFGHPPEVKKPVAECSKCHFKSRKGHFEISGCLNCHTNPHRPLMITLKGKGACLDCHTLQQEQILKNKSRHTVLDCSTCHDTHRKIPDCTKCHMPHSGKISGGCKQCHNAHMPKLVTYAAELPSNECGVCHQKVVDQFSSAIAKHKPLSCAFCHKGKHRMIPSCQDCHGSPHPASIMAKFPKCGKCHNNAHDLNNWALAGAKDVKESAAKQLPSLETQATQTTASKKQPSSEAKDAKEATTKKQPASQPAL